MNTGPRAYFVYTFRTWDIDFDGYYVENKPSYKKVLEAIHRTPRRDPILFINFIPPDFIYFQYVMRHLLAYSCHVFCVCGEGEVSMPNKALEELHKQGKVRMLGPTEHPRDPINVEFNFPYFYVPQLTYIPETFEVAKKISMLLCEVRDVVAPAPPKFSTPYIYANPGTISALICFNSSLYMFDAEHTHLYKFRNADVSRDTDSAEKTPISFFTECVKATEEAVFIGRANEYTYNKHVVVSFTLTHTIHKSFTWSILSKWINARAKRLPYRGTKNYSKYSRHIFNQLHINIPKSFVGGRPMTLLSSTDTFTDVIHI